ncbi:type VI secretion system Vgr family protein [Acinetobacter portensis]|uniref:type VI secretion system Vgr family protein n=1 Tax=Acinetobacter portensis TaxID=1839785 RepID=UPI0013D66C2E|nr:type VI secretion system Vgr family protein [Acinetobacter portensis]
MVNKVEVLPVRNRHACYKITLVPWLWLLTKTTNYRIYQDESVTTILEDILQKYPYPVEYRISGNFIGLDYQVQYGESDFDFISRLMQEHGINYHFEHSHNELTLVISDHNSSFKPMQAEGYQQLDIYPPNQRFPNKAEYIEFFEPAQQLVSGKVYLGDYQFKTPQLKQIAEEQFMWEHLHAENEIYEWNQGDYFDAKEGGQDKARQYIERIYQHGYRAQGKGHLKGLQTGFKFELNNHPNSQSNGGWIVLGTQTTIQDISQEQNTNQYYDSNVEFIVQPDEQVLRPERVVDKPTGRPQTAIVVGPEGEEIYTDQYGRVRVKFHWDRTDKDDRHNPYNNSKPEKYDKTNTCWLRVSTAWAGHNYGTIHIPRIGHEVIIDFFNGDPDMPFISGRLTNPDNMPVWNLPSQQALSGIKSKEFKGSGSNQLVMDDTPGNLQLHLKSDHQSSELNLGHIIRIPDSSGRKDFRGEGFELRTDGHGVVRAAKGLIISTYAKEKAESYVKDIKEIIGVVSTAVKQQKTLIASAIKHKSVERRIDGTVWQKLDAQYETLKGDSNTKFSELSKSHVLLSSEQDVVITSPNTTHIATNDFAVTSSEDTTFSIAKQFIVNASQGLRQFVQAGGIKLISALGKIEIHSQEDDTEIVSEKDINLRAKKTIEINAFDEAIINAGGSYLRISGNGIEFGTPGNWTVFSADQIFAGPKNMAQMFNEMPKSDFDQELFLTLPNGTPAKKVKYEIHHADGSIITGITDELGNTQVQKSRCSANYKVKILGKAE